MSSEHKDKGTQERTPTNTIIRLATLGEAQEVTELIRESYQREAKKGGFEFDATKQTLERTRSSIEKGNTFVAVAGGKIEGTITLISQKAHPEDPGELKGDDIIEFGWFARDERVKGTGVGNQLLSHIEQEAIARGMSRLLAVTAKNTPQRESPLHDYYRARGFTHEVDIPSSHNFPLIALIKQL